MFVVCNMSIAETLLGVSSRVSAGLDWTSPSSFQHVFDLYIKTTYKNGFSNELTCYGVQNILAICNDTYIFEWVYYDQELQV